VTKALTARVEYVVLLEGHSSSSGEYRLAAYQTDACTGDTSECSDVVDWTCADALAPTTEPTTSQPTSQPTYTPTYAPTAVPSYAPTFVPTPKPTSKPTSAPTSEPTSKMTASPTVFPTEAPTSLCDMCCARTGQHRLLRGGRQLLFGAILNPMCEELDCTHC